MKRNIEKLFSSKQSIDYVHKHHLVFDFLLCSPVSLIYRDEFLLESQALVYASRRDCMKSRELNKKMVRWNDTATFDAAELCDPFPSHVAGAFVGASEAYDAYAVAVAGDEVEVVITDAGVPGVVDEGAAAGLRVVNELGVASA